MPKPKLYKTKRITLEYLGVKYWQWPHWGHQWLFPYGKGTAEGIRAFIERQPLARRQRLAQWSAEIVAKLDGLTTP
ncbi:MAG: hypothetical protein OT477_14710 [Chloroflexi bacterium]|nr:hypothetical protein [Chloroflexota bacterium]